MNTDNITESGFIDLPKQTVCFHPGHQIPGNISIPFGKAYVHVCPGCKSRQVITPLQISC